MSCARALLPFACAAALAVCGASGCHNGSTGTDAGNDDSGGQAVTCTSTLTYPPAPYGTTEGFRIADVGARVQTGKDGTPATKKLSDYRADCLAGKTKVLAIFGAAEWCGPCQNEQAELVKDYNDYKAANQPVEFLVLVLQDTHHVPSDDGTVSTWATRFGIPFDLGRDPDGAFGPYFNPDMFPQAMVIKLDDMSIQSFWTSKVDGMTRTAVDAALQ